MSNRPFRQGDVLLVRVDAVPDDATLVDTTDKFTVLKYGEATGHMHRVESPKVKMWSAQGERFLQVVTSTPLVHEEHDTITLPPGVYHIPEQIAYQRRELVRVSD